MTLALLPGLPLAGGAVLRLVQLRRRRRAPAPLSAVALELPAAVESVRPQSEIPALADAGTAAAARKGLRHAVAVLAVGVLSCCCLWVVNEVLDRIDANFMAASARSSGTILSLEPDSRWHSGQASVRFTVEGREVTHDVVLGGLVDDYVEGQHVTVFYDPAAPERATIDDVGYEPGWAGWVMTPLLAGAFVITPYGVWLVVATRQMRRLLRDQPWGVAGVRVFQGDRRGWFITADGGIWRSRVDGDAAWRSGGGGFYPWEVEDSERAWRVWGQKTAVFSPDEGRTLVRARRRPVLPRGVRRSLAKEVAEARLEPAEERPEG
jgi:hypothetical protein